MNDLRTELDKKVGNLLGQYYGCDKKPVDDIINIIRKHLPEKKESEPQALEHIRAEIDGYNSAIDEMNRRLG